MVWEGNYIPFCPFPLEIWQRPVSLPPLQPHGHGHLHLETTPPWEMGFFFDLHYYRGKERFMWGCWKTSEGCSRKVHSSSDLRQTTSFLSPQFPHLLSQGVTSIWKVENKSEDGLRRLGNGLSTGCSVGLCHFTTKECSYLSISVSFAFCTGPESCLLRFISSLPFIKILIPHRLQIPRDKAGLSNAA